MNKQLKSQTKKASATKKAAVKSAPKRKVATVAKKQQKKSPQQQQTRSFFGANPQVKANEEHGAAFVKSKTETGDYHQHPAGFLYRFTTPGQTGKGTSTNASPKPKLSDSVTVHYEGRTIDQKVFDSSYKRGEPISFRLNQVIKGWGLAVQEMSHGDRIECILPANVAYGDRGAGAQIPGGATLIFDIEYLAPVLSEVEKAGTAFYQKAKESGQYKEHKAGFLYKYNGGEPAANAAMPGLNDEVTVHYEGRNVQGKIFDSSIQRGEPTKFPLNGVVPGFSIPISELMTKGTKIQVIIPPSLGYGDQSVHELIPAHSTLIFDIELISWGMGHRF